MIRKFSGSRRTDNGNLYGIVEDWHSPFTSEISGIEIEIDGKPLKINLPDRVIEAAKKLYRRDYVQNGNPEMRNKAEGEFVVNVIVGFINSGQIKIEE